MQNPLALCFMLVSLILLPSITQGAEKIKQLHHAASLRWIKKDINQNDKISPPGNAIIDGDNYPNNRPTPSWIAQINSPVGSCTGQFISSEYVLTAKHCVFDDDQTRYEDAQQVQVFLGGRNKAESDKNAKITVKSIIPWNKPENKDVVLLQLEKAYPNVSSVPIYHGFNFVYGKKGVVLGYGRIGTYKDEQPNSKDLLKWATIDFIDNYSAGPTYQGGGLATKPGDPPIQGNYPSKGDSTSGDSGGPVLSAINASADILTNGKLVSITSTGDSQRSYTAALTDSTLSWIGQHAGAIIKSPIDGQLFANNSSNILVTGYGARPTKVSLTNGKTTVLCTDFKQTNDGWQCDLDISQLVATKTPSENFILSAQRADGTADRVDITIAPNGQDLVITFPKKPQKNETSYIYSTSQAYSVTGTGTANDTLYVRLQSIEPNNLDTEPCINANGVKQQAIKVSPEGNWVCNIMPDSTHPTQLDYLFTVSVDPYDEPNATVPISDRENTRMIDAVQYSVTQDNINPVTITPISPFKQRYPGKTIIISGTGQAGARISVHSSPEKIGDITDVNNNKDWRIREYLSEYLIGKTTITADMYVDPNSFQYRKPDSSDSIELNIAANKLGFITPKPATQQTAEIVNYSALHSGQYILSGIIDGYPFSPQQTQKESDQFNYAIVAIKTNDKNTDPYILCANSDFFQVTESNWQCKKSNKTDLVPPGSYQLIFLIYQYDLKTENIIRQESTYMNINSDLTFTIPTQIQKIDDADLFPLEQAKNGIDIQGKYASDKNNNTTLLMQYQKVLRDKNGEMKGDGPLLSCTPDRGNINAQDIATWGCKKIKFEKAGDYLLLISNKSDFIDDEALTVLRVTELSLNNPKNGEIISDEAVIPKGTATPNSQITCEATTPTGASAQLSIGEYSDTVTAASNGSWSCKALPTPAKGQYNFTATETINQKKIDTTNANFSVKRNNDDNNEPSCPSGYTKTVGGCINGKPTSPGSPGSSGAGGGSTGAGGAGGSGGCPTGFILHLGLCSGPFTDGPGGGGGLPAHRYCPEGYSYNTATHSCQGNIINDNCPSGYIYDDAKKQCIGPAAGGPDFKILAPYNQQLWDCGKNCNVLGQVAAEDSARVIVVDKASGKTISGPYDSKIYQDILTLWQAESVALKPGTVLDIFATRMHNGNPVPGVDNTQAIEITTPLEATTSDFTIDIPQNDAVVKDSERYTISGQAQTGSQIKVTGDLSCTTYSTAGQWSCVFQNLVERTYNISALNYDTGGNLINMPVSRHFFVQSDMEVSNIAKVDEKSYCIDKRGDDMRHSVCSTTVRVTNREGEPLAQRQVNFSVSGDHSLNGSTSPEYSDSNGEIVINTISRAAHNLTYGTLTVSAENVSKDFSLPYFN